MKTQKSLSVFCLGMLMLASFSLNAEAQRRGAGGHRARTGTVTRSSPSGPATGTFRTQMQNDRSSKTRTVNRDGQVSTPRGDRTVQGQNTTQRTGENTYDREWNRTTTDGQSTRTWSGQGSGTVEKTESGATRSYEGTATSPKGQEYTVTKSAETVKTEDGFERETTKTVTDSSGNVVGTGQSSTAGVKGEGTSTSGSWTGPAGQTSTYQGQSQRDEGAINRTWMTTSPNGQTRSGEAQWQVDGQPAPGEGDSED